MWRSLWQWLFLFSCFSCSISESSTPSDFKLWGAFTFSRPCLASHRINYGSMEGNWPSFVCIQDTKHVEREARAVPHLPARLHRRRLPLLQQPQVFPRLLRQVSWCRCHEYNRILYLIIQVKQTLRNLECSDLGIKPRYFLIMFARYLLHIKLHTYPIKHKD